MILQYQLVFEDILALQKNFITVTKYHKRKEKITFIVLLIFSFLLFFNILFELLVNFLPLNSVAIIATSGGIILTILLSPFIRTIYTKVTIWQYKRAFNKTRHLDWPRDFTTILNDEGVEININNSKVKGKTSFSWEAFKKVSQDTERFYLYHTATEALVIPKRLLSDSEKKFLSDILNLKLGHLFK